MNPFTQSYSCWVSKDTRSMQRFLKTKRWDFRGFCLFWAVPAVVPGVEPIPLGILHIGIVVLRRSKRFWNEGYIGGYLPGEPVEMAVELLNPTLWHTCDQCVHGRNKTKDSGLSRKWLDGLRQKWVSHGVAMPQAELFAHIPARVWMCAPHTGIAELGAAFMHIWAAYQICGAKQQICEGGRCMQWLMHICRSCGLGRHTCPALGVVGPHQTLHLNTPPW